MKDETPHQIVEQLERIKSIVAESTGVTVAEMESKCRKREIIIARQRYSYLARTHTAHSFKVIGQHLGNRDHTTIIHTMGEINQRLQDDPAEYTEIQQLETKIVKGKVCSLQECIRSAEKDIGLVNGNISEIIKKAWFEGFEQGKKFVPAPIVREKVIIKKIYVYDEPEVKVKITRPKAEYSNLRLYENV